MCSNCFQFSPTGSKTSPFVDKKSVCIHTRFPTSPGLQCPWRTCSCSRCQRVRHCNACFQRRQFGHRHSGPAGRSGGARLSKLVRAARVSQQYAETQFACRSVSLALNPIANSPLFRLRRQGVNDVALRPRNYGALRCRSRRLRRTGGGGRIWQATS